MPRGAPGQPRKPGAGRKPGFTVRLQREYLADKQGEAEFAFAYLVAMMRGEQKRDLLAIQVCREVLDRVWGKPTNTVRLKTWRDEIVGLIRERKATPESVREWFGVDLANELFLEAGVIESGVIIDN